MSDEKTYQMNVNIGKRVRHYLIFFVVLILLLIWREELVELVTTIISGDRETAEISKEIIKSIIIFIGGVILIILNLGRDIDLHNLIDRKIFHVRKKAGEIIHDYMIEAATSVNAVNDIGFENMKNKKKEVMYLFYHFVNEQEVLRDLAFTYWEQYFVNIYIIVFSIIGFVISSILIIIKGEFDLIIPITFAAFAFLVYLRTRFSLLKKIYDLPRQQIEEIKTSQSSELKQEVEKRFLNE